MLYAFDMHFSILTFIILFILRMRMTIINNIINYHIILRKSHVIILNYGYRWSVYYYLHGIVTSACHSMLSFWITHFFFLNTVGSAAHGNTAYLYCLFYWLNQTINMIFTKKHLQFTAYYTYRWKSDFVFMEDARYTHSYIIYYR